MSKAKESASSHLRELRESAGLTVRELARQIGTNHPNVIYWEKAGRVAKTEFLLPMAKALGVSVEELLGAPKSKRTAPGGRVGLVFEKVSKIPRRQQSKILDVVEALVDQHEAKAS